MRQRLRIDRNQQTNWLGISRQWSAAKGNMGGYPPLNEFSRKGSPDE